MSDQSTEVFLTGTWISTGDWAWKGFEVTDTRREAKLGRCWWLPTHGMKWGIKDWFHLEKTPNPCQAPARLWTTGLDHSPEPWAPAAPQALPPALCQAAPHKHQRCSQHELFAGVIYIQDRKTHWIVWGINNSLFAFSWSDSFNTPVHEEMSPNILVVSHLNSQSIMH